MGLMFDLEVGDGFSEGEGDDEIVGSGVKLAGDWEGVVKDETFCFFEPLSFIKITEIRIKTITATNTIVLLGKLF